MATVSMENVSANPDGLEMTAVSNSVPTIAITEANVSIGNVNVLLVGKALIAQSNPVKKNV